MNEREEQMIFEEGRKRGREEALKELIETLAEGVTYEDILTGDAEAKGYVQGFEDGLKADRPKGEWIPCEERLPSEDGEYLVTWGEGFVSAFYYGKPTNYRHKEIKGKCFYEYNDEYGDAVCNDAIAWMPLPKPWEGADDE